MKVGIYNEPRESGIGGSEVSVAVLAEALSKTNEVEIVHHKQYLTREQLSEVSGTDLRDVRLRHVPAEAFPFGSRRFPVQRYRDARRWQSVLTKPYDLFINFTHGFPPFCHSRVGALVVLFPFHERPGAEVRRNDSSLPKDIVFSRLKNLYHEWEWRKRLDTYQVKATISRFSQTWTRRRWGIECEVIYPPADTRFKPRAKRNIILSVGRFSATGHSKKQLEMVAAFGGLKRTPSWKYFSAGGVSPAEEDLRYFETVNRSAQHNVNVLGNLDRNRLQRLYQQSKIFWHAAGYGDDQNHPELSEHFGLATVEAMSAGCVPVVVNRGGQPEIVEHQVSGFVWNNLEELAEYTSLLMRDEQLRIRMSRAARTRAAVFSRARFISRFSEVLRI